AGQTVVTGTAGTVRIQNGQVTLADADGRRALYPEEEPAEPSPAAEPSERPTQLESMTSHETMAYTQLCSAFARAIRGDEPEGDVPLPTFVDGVAAMAVMDAARASAAADGVLVGVSSS